MSIENRQKRAAKWPLRARNKIGHFGFTYLMLG
jgi:hypothetical protein